MTDDPLQTARRSTKPRIALMGEFSAGKSTLANLLLQQGRSPVQVTATQVPPVWYSHGSGGVCLIAPDGTRVPMEGDDWTSVAPADAQLIEVELEAETLESVDLIDLPGTSDPNLPIRYWETMMPQIDIAIWCTPSNQAWRQSEAALWDCAPPELCQRSLLLVTRMDKIRSETDKIRILQRVSHEAEGLFARVLPISLTDALAAPERDDVMERSGAADMVRFLLQSLDAVGLTDRPAYRPHIPEDDGKTRHPVFADARRSAPDLVLPRRIYRRSSTAEGQWPG